MLEINQRLIVIPTCFEYVLLWLVCYFELSISPTKNTKSCSFNFLICISKHSQCFATSAMLWHTFQTKKVNVNRWCLLNKTWFVLFLTLTLSTYQLINLSTYQVSGAIWHNWDPGLPRLGPGWWPGSVHRPGASAGSWCRGWKNMEKPKKSWAKWMENPCKSPWT